MIKSLRKILLSVLTLTSFSLFAQVVDVPWTGTAGEFEAAVANNGGVGEFRLEDGKTYLMLDHVPVPENGVLKVMGSGSTDMHPATLQPSPNAEGAISLTDGQMFNLVGDNAELHLHHLILNAMAVNEAGQVGIAAARADQNKIVVDYCTVSGVSSLAFHTMGTGTDFHITNSTMTDWTSYPGGAFYGGAIWGGGSWMGTMDEVIIENNTFQGVVGECLVIYEYVDVGSRVNHNTFANISMGAFYYYTGNNLQIANNLFYNTRAYGQSTNDVTGWGVVWPGGVGQLESRMKTLGTSEVDGDGNPTGLYTMGDGQVVDMNNRNVYWRDNVVTWSPALIDWVNSLAGPENSWEWVTTTTDSNGVETSVTTRDTMFSVAVQARVHSDTAIAAVTAGVGINSTRNVLLSAESLGSNIDENYIINQLARTLDFRDNQSTDGVGANHEWVFQNDGNHAVVEWPLHLDVSYSTTCNAYTHSTQGFPVGNLHAFPDKLAEWQLLSTDQDNSVVTPNSFTLAQNYPNPFNPSTEIAFSLELDSNIELTIFNVIGQKVKVLENGTRSAGTHTIKWDGRDELGGVVPTGLYFYQLTDGTNSMTKKMALMK